jgi:hypothetical protein
MRKCAIAARFVFSAAVLIAFSSASRACEDYWTAAYKCMQGCGPCGGGPGPSPPPIDYPTLRLNDLTGRFTALLDDLRMYEIPDIDDLYGAAPPTSLDELGARIDRVYVEASFQKERRYWQYEQNAKLLNYSMPALRAEVAALQSKLASAPERLKDAETRRDEVAAKAAAEELRAGILRANALALRDEFLATRTSAVGPILELLPGDLRGQFSAATTRREQSPVYAIEEPEPQPVAAKDLPAAPVAAKASLESVVGPMEKPQPVSGSIEDKLKAFDDVKSVLGYVKVMLPSQERRLPALTQEAAELRRQQGSLSEQLSAIESPLATANALADEAEQRFLAAQLAEKASAGNALRLAAAAVVWEHVRDTVVVPQIETILEENGLSNGVAGLQMLNRIRESPQDFLPKVGPLKDIPRLIDTAKKVVDVEENMETLALAAATSNAQADTAESQALIARLFSGLNREGIEIMRTASEAMDGPRGKIVQVLMERAPKGE